MDTSALTKKVISDTEFADISFIEELKLIQIIWKGKVDGENYKKTFMIALDFGVDHEVDFFMSDIRQQVIIGPRERKWFEEVAIPLAVERGLKKGCTVFDGNIFKEYYLNHILLRTVKFNLPFKFFKTIDQAQEWLLS
jgi:hypothetical protein